MTRTLTILGCGSSGGVPRVAQGWGACDPHEPRNRRRRCSVLLEQTGEAGKTVALIDVSPDLREQLIDAGVTHLDGVWMTHAHADHCHGIDDLRPLTIQLRKRIEIHMDGATSAELHAKFGYIFQTPHGSSYPPILDARTLEHAVVSRIAGAGGEIAATPFELEHGDIHALGFRVGGLAYSPDLNGIPERSLAFLEGLDVWVVDALRYARHPSHFSLEETLAWIERLRPRRAVLTNLHTDLDYATLKRQLPPNVEPAFDGMRIEGF